MTLFTGKKKSFCVRERSLLRGSESAANNAANNYVIGRAEPGG
jgi:hypothetical protein